MSVEILDFQIGHATEDAGNTPNRTRNPTDTLNLNDPLASHAVNTTLELRWGEPKEPKPMKFYGCTNLFL